jgi:hypothetical protein
MADVFNVEKHTKVDDIFIISGDVNFYKVISINPLRLIAITEYESKTDGYSKYF